MNQLCTTFYHRYHLKLTFGGGGGGGGGGRLQKCQFSEKYVYTWNINFIWKCLAHLWIFLPEIDITDVTS